MLNCLKKMRFIAVLGIIVAFGPGSAKISLADEPNASPTATDSCIRSCVAERDRCGFGYSRSQPAECISGTFDTRHAYGNGCASRAWTNRRPNSFS